MNNPYNRLPAFLGACVTVALAAVSSTVLFNLLAWVEAGSGLTFEQAYTAVPRFPFYGILSIGLAVASNVGGGWIAAKLSAYQPYLNSLISGFIVLGWATLMMASPLQQGGLGLLTLVQLFLLPIPCAIVGAHLFLRQR